MHSEPIVTLLVHGVCHASAGIWNSDCQDVGGHAIVIVGMGMANGTKYWVSRIPETKHYPNHITKPKCNAEVVQTLTPSFCQMTLTPCCAETRVLQLVRNSWGPYCKYRMHVMAPHGTHGTDIMSD